MKLSQKQKDHILDRLHEAWPSNAGCAMCGNNTRWDIDMVCEVREYNEGPQIGGAPILPLVSVTCSQCSLVHMFHAIRLGVVDAETGKLKTS